MYSQFVIVDEIGKVVAATNTAVIAALQAVNPNFVGLNYIYGHPKEVNQTLTQMIGAYDVQKYPLIALFQDFAETNKAGVGFQSEVKLHMIIACITDQNYKASERYANNFKPILYPVYWNFLEQLALSTTFSTPLGANYISHTKIDRLFWGNEKVVNGTSGTTKNIFNDWLDVIEIRDLKLPVYENDMSQTTGLI